MAKIISMLVQVGLVSGGLISNEQAQMLSSLTDGLLSFVLALAIMALSIGLPILLRSFHLHLQSLKTNTQWSFLAQIANNVVQSAEQTILHGDNVTKYDYAAKVLTDTAKAHGIKWVTPDVSRMLIESALYGMQQAVSERSKP